MSGIRFRSQASIVLVCLVTLTLASFSLAASSSGKLDGRLMELAARIAAMNGDAATKEHVEALMKSGYFQSRLVEALEVVRDRGSAGTPLTSPSSGITKQQATDLAFRQMQGRYAGGMPDGVQVSELEKGFNITFTFRTPGSSPRTSYYVVDVDRSGRITATRESGPF